MITLAFLFSVNCYASVIACFGKTAKCYYAGYCGYITHAVTGTEFPSLYIYIAIVIASCIFFPALQTYYGVNSTLSVDLHTKIMFVAFIIFSGDSLLIFIDTLITGVFLIPFSIWMNYIEFQSTPLQHFSCTYTHLKMPCRHMPWIIDLVEKFHCI